MANEKYSEVFGRNLRRFRDSLGQTRQAFVTGYEGFSATLQGYESGKKLPNLRRFLHLCNSLKVSPNRLLDGLFTWDTKLSDVRELEAIMSGISGSELQRMTTGQSLFLNCLLDTPPKLEGVGLGERIRLLRIDADLEVSDLAERCLVAKSTLQGYESGQYDPGIPTFMRLCEAFGVSPEYLLAPELKQLSYADRRIAALRPRQIKALLDITRYLINHT